MRRMKRAINKIIQQTEEGEIEWQESASGRAFISEIAGEKVKIYENGLISVNSWKQKTEEGVDLYKTIREMNRPEFVDEFIDSILNS